MDIYIYIRYRISFFSPPLPLDSTKKMEEEGREKRDEVETRKRVRDGNATERRIYIYIHIYIEEGVAVLLVDFPFSYSI